MSIPSWSPNGVVWWWRFFLGISCQLLLSDWICCCWLRIFSCRRLVLGTKAADGQRYDLNIGISQGRDGCLHCVLPCTLSCMRIKPWKLNNIRFDNRFYATLSQKLVTWMIIGRHCLQTKNIRLIFMLFWVKYKLGKVFDDLPIIVSRKSSTICHTEKHCFVCIYSQPEYVVLFSQIQSYLAQRHDWLRELASANSAFEVFIKK